MWLDWWFWKWNSFLKCLFVLYTQFCVALHQLSYKYQLLKYLLRFFCSSVYLTTYSVGTMSISVIQGIHCSFEQTTWKIPWFCTFLKTGQLIWMDWFQYLKASLWENLVYVARLYYIKLVSVVINYWILSVLD